MAQPVTVHLAQAHHHLGRKLPENALWQRQLGICTPHDHDCVLPGASRSALAREPQPQRLFGAGRVLLLLLILLLLLLILLLLLAVSVKCVCQAACRQHIHSVPEPVRALPHCHRQLQPGDGRPRHQLLLQRPQCGLLHGKGAAANVHAAHLALAAAAEEAAGGKRCLGVPL